MTICFALLMGCLNVISAAEDEVGASSHQITVMVIRASKGTGPTDPKLTSVEDRLSRILPDHRFVLIDGKTRRLEPGQAMSLIAGEHRVVTVELDQPDLTEGKVAMHVRLVIDGLAPFSSNVKTPPNQLFFLDRKMTDEEHLLIAVGAR